MVDDALAQLTACESYVVAAFASVSAYRGIGGTGGRAAARRERRWRPRGKPVTLVALGNPYLLRDFPDVTAYLATFSNVPPSEIAAVKALFGEIAIRGHMPVSIPGLARYGDGIQLQATRSQPPAVNRN